WLLAIWLGAGPSLLDLLAGWAQDPIPGATEQHMLGATPTNPGRTGPSLLDRVQMLMLAGIAVLLMLGLVLVPWVGLPLCGALGAAVAAIVYLQPPLAVRGMPLRARLEALRRQPWRALGFGVGMQLAAGVPFLNLLALLPVATIAATSTVLHATKPGAARADLAGPGREG
ncbi:MAG: EI24 domain-containing protein, partial [Planctomycetes bacterium]|nr:EI24 domain-containing protein [Planctomycetota bacterium]